MIASNEVQQQLIDRAAECGVQITSQVNVYYVKVPGLKARRMYYTGVWQFLARYLPKRGNRINIARIKADDAALAQATVALATAINDLAQILREMRNGKAVSLHD